VPYGPASHIVQSTKSDNTSWKGTIDYDLAPDQLVYATVSTGYRGGGMAGDTSLPKEYLTYKPEKVMNYELGWKGQFLDNRLGLNVALFNMEYKNMQVYAIEHNDLGNPTPVTVNAATARVRGAEVEWMWRLTQADTITGYATYLDAHISKFPNAVNSSVNPDGIYNNYAALLGLGALPTNVQVNFAGKRLPNAPRQTFKVSYSHLFDFGTDGTLTPDLSVYWQSKVYPDLANTEVAATGNYTKSDFNLTYVSESNHLSVNFYAHNLENRIRWQNISAAFASYMATYGTPRTYGIRVAYRYN
jgi:iron complex outermembrane receptor protein